MPYQLKTRIAFAVSLLTLTLMGLLSWLTLAHFQQQFKAAAAAHLRSSLATTATHITGQMQFAQRMLTSIGALIHEEVLADRGAMQRFLDSQGTSLLTFDNGLILFAPDGRLLAVNPRQDDVIDKDFSFRDYISVPRTTRQPYVSMPFKSRQEHQHPIIMFSEPIIDGQGNVAAILGGSLDLYGRNFLQTLLNSETPEDGTYLLIDQQGAMVLHPQRANIMKAAKELYPAEWLAQLSAASQGPLSNIAIDGVTMTGAFTRLPALDWTLMFLVPQDQQLRPIQQARTYLAIALLALAALTVLAVRALSSRLTKPLAELAGKVRRQTSKQDQPLSIKVSEYAELGDLADSIQLLMTDVSAKRKDLRDQLTFLQNLIDTIPGPIFYKDLEYRYLGCNRAFEGYIGIPREALVGKSVFDIAPPNLARVYHQADVDLWEQGGEQVYEASVKYADGSLHDVIFYKKVFRDTQGEPAGMIGTFLDITDRKKSEMALLASERRFRLLVENAADAFFLHDEAGRILDVNQQACESLGYTREELLALSVPDISIDYDLKAVKDLQVRMTSGEKITAEDRHRCKDGRVFPVEVRLCHTEQEGGMVIALARDISARKRDEEILKQALQEAQLAKEQVDNVLSSAADGLIVTNRRNRITHINQIAAEILGVSINQVLGKPFTSLFGDLNLREQAKLFLKGLTKNSRQFDFKLNLSSSRFPRIVQARSSLLLTVAGHHSGYVTLLRDVSRERELDQLKSEFISTAAHEMRTPMSVIMGYVEMLMDDDQFGHFSDEMQEEFLAEVYRKSEALTRIIDDLFDISRIEAGLPLPITRADCNLNDVIRNVVSHFEKNSGKHLFVMDLEGEATFRVDCSKMSQVFENLVSNAVKYSPQGGHIAIRSYRQGDHLRIDIEDQGCGMTDEQLERIFDKFYRADSSDTAVSGLGLGMSIVKAIVEGHDGRIWVNSEPGSGTCVSLEIPCS